MVQHALARRFELDHYPERNGKKLTVQGNESMNQGTKCPSRDANDRRIGHGIETQTSAHEGRCVT
jgi:hypothetical protein